MTLLLQFGVSRIIHGLGMRTPTIHTNPPPRKTGSETAEFCPDGGAPSPSHVHPVEIIRVVMFQGVSPNAGCLDNRPRRPDASHDPLPFQGQVNVAKVKVKVETRTATVVYLSGLPA